METISKEEIKGKLVVLSGSPPKGYAIVIPELRKINLYDHTGKGFRILRDAVLEEEIE